MKVDKKESCIQYNAKKLEYWFLMRALEGLAGLFGIPLAEQLWDPAVEELITGPAGQSCCL